MAPRAVSRRSLGHRHLPGHLHLPLRGRPLGPAPPRDLLVGDRRGGDRPGAVAQPLQIDPPAHTGYRRLLNPEFTPKIAALEANVRVLVDRLIDGFVDHGSCNFHEEFATPLPSTIFLRLAGLPQADLPMFLRWRDNTVRPEWPTTTSRARPGSERRRAGR